MIDSDRMDKSLDHDENKLGAKTSLSNLSNLSINLIGTGPTENSLNANQILLNEKVAQLANSIYTELEKMIKQYGKETVKELMPVVVSVLEALDAAYHEKEELLVENELLRDDNDKLLLQYEREKQARKDTELVLILFFIKRFKIILILFRNYFKVKIRLPNRKETMKKKSKVWSLLSA